MADVLLSYASHDVDRIKPLVEVIEGHGWSVWWDRKIRIGKSFDHVIEEEIAKAKCMLVVWSKESVSSDWVKSEAAEGKRRNILAPVLIDDVAIPLEFRRTEAAKLYNWKGDLSHPELTLLIQAIEEIVGQLATPIVPPAVRKDYSKLIIACAILVFLLIGGIIAFKYWASPAVGKLGRVRGEGQTLAVGEWKSFAAKVSNAEGQPVAGVKVAWQTPECGSRIFVRRTDLNGEADATNMCSNLPAGPHSQTVVIVKEEAPEGFTEVDKVVPIGKALTFTYFVIEKPYPGAVATPTK